MSDLLFRPGPPRGAYHQKNDGPRVFIERALEQTRLRFRQLTRRPVFLRRFVDRVASREPALEGLSDSELLRRARMLRGGLHAAGLRSDAVADAFALVREAARRRLGQRHYDVQIIGGRFLLDGWVTEMETGEGKTLTATLAASAAALAGVPVHIITVNDYLAHRDAQWMGPVYESLGLRVGSVVHGMTHEARREAYACDVTYCTNKEIAFDYLRDRIALGGDPSHLHLTLERLAGGTDRGRRLILRGLHFGIVDEADSVLVDEARTPLIISSSQNPEDEKLVYETALELARSLGVGRHFKVDRNRRQVELTAAGKGKLEELGRVRGKLWMRRQLREELVVQALSAIHLYFVDQHYLVRDDRVQIIDEYTGRLMPDRSWERGLHQLIEVKEGCSVTAQNRTLARISYQKFFRRYLRLAGMTGTAREVAGELRQVYGLTSVRIPTNRPCRRRSSGDRVFSSRDEKWSAVVKRVREVHERGRPILIGTRTVEASELLSRLLDEAGLRHCVLNARQDREEAEIIARSGQEGHITVATNMAGRGTDIVLGPGVAERGGLHVIATELHDARRIDRQLYGRCARQGDPGSHEAIASLEDDLIESNVETLRRLAGKLGLERGPLLAGIGRLLLRVAQRRAEGSHSRVRRDLLRMDEYLDGTLAFSGVPE